jgi:hypothetical protein
LGLGHDRRGGVPALDRVFIWLGLRTLRHGHWVMFLVGIVLPIFWIIGALIPRRG